MGKLVRNFKHKQVSTENNSQSQLRFYEMLTIEELKALFWLYIFLDIPICLKMADEALARAGLHFEEINKIRVLEPEVAQQTTELKDECREFVESMHFYSLKPRTNLTFLI